MSGYLANYTVQTLQLKIDFLHVGLIFTQINIIMSKINNSMAILHVLLVFTIIMAQS